MSVITLTGLYGTGGRVLDAVLFERPETAPRLLKYHRAVAVKGPLGMIRIWRDDKGRFCAERTHFHNVQTSALFHNADDLEPWIRAQLTLIGREAA